VRALRRFTVRATLPPELAALNDLVMNLRWSWHQETLDLFASVDPDVWQACGNDPVRLLGGVSPARLAGLARDKRFLRRLAAAADDLNDYLTQPRWHQEVGDGPEGVAYFSMEFGLTEVLPQYSGGLGILAGDHLKAASDLGVPIIGVGLLYRAGYFAQGLSRDGWQQEHYPSIDPHGLPLALVRDADGAALRVSLGLPGGRTLRAQVWKVQVGRVPLLLLDSDIEENEATERQVTDKLYGGTSEHRMAQEMLAGVGGVRAVRAYCELTGSPPPGSPSTRRCRRSAPAPSSPPTPRSRPASTASAGTWSGRTTSCRSGRRCRWTGCSSSAPRPTRTCSTWPTWACGWPSGRTA
jgi:starch phosphorylase